jgi:hypothetical protein
MFGFWAGATASFFVGSLSVSGVFAAEFGSSLTPHAGSQSSAAYFLADANYSSRADAANFWGGASGTAFSKTGDSAALQTSAFVDLVPSSQFGVGLSPMSFMVSTSSKGMPTLTNSGTTVDTYFSVFETLSKQEMNGVRLGTSFVAPIGGNSTSRPMR